MVKKTTFIMMLSGLILHFSCDSRINNFKESDLTLDLPIIVKDTSMPDRNVCLQEMYEYQLTPMIQDLVKEYIKKEIKESYESYNIDYKEDKEFCINLYTDVLGDTTILYITSELSYTFLVGENINLHPKLFFEVDGFVVIFRTRFDQYISYDEELIRKKLELAFPKQIKKYYEEAEILIVTGGPNACIVKIVNYSIVSKEIVFDSWDLIPFR